MAEEKRQKAVQPWLPVPKAVVRDILHASSRPFPESIAYLSVALDCDNGRDVTASGYAALWGWGRGKVTRFLKRIGASIEYPEGTRGRQNQRGHIVLTSQNGRTDSEQIPDRCRTDNGQIKLICFSNLETKASRYRTDREQIPDRSWRTTVETDTDTDPIKEYCSERLQESSEPSGIEIILNTKQLYQVPTQDVEEWRQLFPAVDVLGELRKMAAWAKANPAKRKTRRGINRFIVAWLSREQDKGGSRGSFPGSPPQAPAALTPKQQKDEEEWNRLLPPS